MKKLFASIALALSAFAAHGVNLFTDPSYGVDYTSMLQAWTNNTNVATVYPKNVVLSAPDSTSISVSIYGIGNLTFTGSKVAGNATRPDIWTGTAAGGYTMLLYRNGEFLTGSISKGTWTVARWARYNSAGHGGLFVMKAENAQRQGMSEDTF